MQASSLLCSASSASPPLASCPSQLHSSLSRFQLRNSVLSSSFPYHLPFQSLRIHRLPPTSIHCTATQEIAKNDQSESKFVGVGYISSIHGLQGEPGRRWLRQQVSGREIVQEIELVEGRGYPGQKSWIVKFNEIDTVEQAQELVGSTLMVTEEERPVLEEAEFYTRDLVGIKVLLKETEELVGTVVNVFNSGANDLLHVKVDSSFNAFGDSEKPNQEVAGSEPHLWIPFVEAIVPNVDLDRGQMLITPPKGLLQLNIRSDERSKKERRQLEWKERKKIQKRLIAAKKKLHEMEQHHIFHGFRYGEKGQRSLLAYQIVAVNSKLLQYAMENMEISSKRWHFPEFSSFLQTKSALRLSKEGSCTESGTYAKLEKSGQLLTSGGKIAIVLILEETETERSFGSDVESERNKENISVLVESLLNDDQRSIKIGHRSSVPLILVSAASSVASLKEIFSNHDYFSFNQEKVWFLEEEKLPVVGCSDKEQKGHRILMKSPWEILQRPVGSGGVLSLLSSDSLLDNLSEMGVEYIAVCSINQGFRNGYTLLGLADSRKANIGIDVCTDTEESAEEFNLIFSVNFMKRLTKLINKLPFHAIPRENPHVEMVEKEWVDAVPSSPNSYEFHCSIYSCLKFCTLDKMCLLEVTD